MNILVICHYGLYQDFTSSFVHAQAKAYVRLGHRVRVVIPIAVGKQDWDGSRLSARPRVEDGVELLPLRCVSLSNYGKGGFNTRSALAALRVRMGAVLSGFSPDVVHAHTLGLDSALGAWLKARLHVPLVVTTHGSDTSIPVEQGRGASLKPLCDEADRVIAVSSALADKLRACGTTTPITVILNGFDLHGLPKGVEKTPCSLLQAGHLLKQKRAHVTIRAFAAVKARHPEASLTVIGQGPEREALEALCRELGVEDAVRFTGQVPNRTVLAEMAKAQFFIMPSVREGFGIVYLEAMACGCVTIGTEREGIADLIVSGENGFLVPSDDPEAIVATVEACLRDPEKTAALSVRGRQAAKGLSWEQNAGEYIRLFQLLTEENREI